LSAAAEAARLTPGLPAAEEEVGGAGGHGDDGDRDGHRGLQPLPLQDLHAPAALAPFPSRGRIRGWSGSAGRDSRAGFGLVWTFGMVTPADRR